KDGRESQEHPTDRSPEYQRDDAGHEGDGSSEAKPHHEVPQPDLRQLRGIGTDQGLARPARGGLAGVVEDAHASRRAYRGRATRIQAPQTTRLEMRTPRRRATTAPRAALTVNAAAPSSMPLALAIASAWPFAATMTARFARATEGAAEKRPAKRFGLRVSETRANATTKRPPLA